jgi:hypothetical protein
MIPDPEVCRRCLKSMNERVRAKLGYGIPEHYMDGAIDRIGRGKCALLSCRFQPSIVSGDETEGVPEFCKYMTEQVVCQGNE